MADTTVDLSGDMDLNEPLLIQSNLQRFKNLSPQAVGAWWTSRRQNVRAWTVFLNSNKFHLPKTTSQVTERVIRNIDYFQSNYLFVFIILAVYCLLTSPLLLIVLAASFGACYIIKLKNVENQIRVCGRELNLAQQYAAVGLISIPLFLLAGAGSVIFWLIGASLVIILAHASCFGIETLNLEDDEFAKAEVI